MLMNSEHNKRSFLNIAVTTVGQVITIACGLIIPRLFIGTFGSEVNGMISTINQLFVYIALLEAGVGTATTQALYRPVAQNDRKGINSILAATDRFYRRTGVFYLIAVFILGIVFPYVVKTDVAGSTIFAYTMLHGAAGVLTYFLQGKYLLLLTVEGKHYIDSAVSTILNVLSSLSKVIIVMLGGSIIDVQIVFLLLYAVRSTYYIIYIRRNYKWIDLSVTPDFGAISQRNSVLVHQVSSLVFNNTDTLFLSVFCGLKVVSVYTVYNLFYDMISTLINNLNSGITFRMGQLFNTDKEKYLKVYDVYEPYYTTFSFALYNICYLFMMPFMRLYTDGFEDRGSYLLPLLPFLFAVMKLQVSGRAPSGFTASYAGHFKQNNIPAILEAVINVTVTVAAIQFLGIYGAIIGTIVALLYRANQMILYANLKILNRSPWKTYRTWVIDIALFALFTWLNSIITVNMSSYFLLVLWACIYGLIILAGYLTVISLFNPEAFRLLLVFIKSFVRKKRST